ncbi:MAG: hypothetical protein JNL41_11340, partial [Phenylobacterium sp.]|uniref:hypothetical protein n=1 Tax=Phenylobacterium sp. TaxID=1871053 RepID=UPI001A563A35
NGKVKEVVLTAQGERMRRDAQRAMLLMGEELGRRLGQPALLRAAQLLHQEWGDPPTFDPEEVGRHD